MDNRTESGDRREQRDWYYSKEEQGRRQKELQELLKNMDPKVREKLFPGFLI